MVATLIGLGAAAGCAGEPAENEAALATTAPGPDGLTAEQGGPVAATVCIETSTAKCYCSGVGCVKLCRDVIVVSMGGGSSSTGGGRFAGFYPGYPTVRVGSGAWLDTAAAVAVFGPKADIEAGRARIFVRDRRGAIVLDRAGLVADVNIRAGIHTVTMDFLSGLLDPAPFLFEVP